MLTSVNNVYNQLNKVYMAMLMGTTMGLIMSGLTNNKIGVVIYLAATILVLVLIRKQAGIDDRSFAKAMIEHHDAAIFMSASVEKKTEDPFIKQLATTIQKTQALEIREMKTWLAKTSH